MAVRSLSPFILFFSAAITLLAQEIGFPPSKAWRAQLEERGPVRDIGLRDAIEFKYGLRQHSRGHSRQSHRGCAVVQGKYCDRSVSVQEVWRGRPYIESADRNTAEFDGVRNPAFISYRRARGWRNILTYAAATPAFKCHDFAGLIASFTASIFFTPTSESQSSSALNPLVA